MRNLILPLMLLSLLASCSNSTSKTAAKLKLNLAGITAGTGANGAGGIILFGKSSTGEQFGKLINSTEQELELVNGDWTFYALMWPSVSGKKIAEPAFCGKSSAKLSGTASTIAFNLTNQNCAGNDFSNGHYYTDSSSKIRFSKFLLDECDVVEGNIGCSQYNRGSALSYRMSFRNYTKSPAGVVTFGADSLKSECVAATGGSTMYSMGGMQIEFPASKNAMPFVISTEMFLGTFDCGASLGIDSKGVYTQAFIDGLDTPISGVSSVVASTGSQCDTWNSGTSQACEANNGYWTAGSCQLPSDLAPFMDPTSCVAPVTTAVRSIKQLVTIPKEFLCRNLNTGIVGADVFPGGNGSNARPYKICNEWQLNQIGESNVFSAFSFKLMNDLDMNKTDFDPAARPACAGVAGSVLKKHHNLNPLDQVLSGGCDSASVVGSNSFSGVFNGNNKTISNGRIYADVEDLGFVRKMGTNAFIFDLNFKNLEVEGISRVGLIAGKMLSSSNGRIQNVKINKGYVEADANYAGGIAGVVYATNSIDNVHVRDVDVNAKGGVGGLAGNSSGTISNSMFRGEVKQYSSIDERVGGLVGLADTGSTINSSFSEGRVLSYAKHTGGIAGHNMGTINNSYSTMFVQSRYGSTSAVVGGIAGSNESGTISNAYFDGIVSYEGGASGSSVDGIAGYSGSSQTNCFSSSNNVSASGCDYVTDLRSGMHLNGNISWQTGAVDNLPRLSWEVLNASRPCLLASNTHTIISQIAAGRGVATNPLVICTPTQLRKFGVDGINKFAVLMEDINLSSWINSDLIPNNTETFDGKGHSIMGLNMAVTDVNDAFIKNNTGKIVNLNVYGSTITQSASNAASGVLVGANSGTISNIKMAGNSVMGKTYVGLIAGSQSGAGVIDNIVIEDSKVRGGTYAGAVTGFNEGKITRAYVNATVSEHPSVYDYNTIGGVVGRNNSTGVLDQISFGGQLNFTTVSTNAATYVGGIIGFNEGRLTNSMTKNYSQINAMNSTSIGGLVGYNEVSGQIIKSFSLGKLIYKQGEVDVFSDFHPIAGFNDGNIDVNTFFLEKSTAGLVGTSQVGSCSGTLADFTPYAPAYLVFSSPGANLMATHMNTSGDSLRTLMPMSLGSDFSVNYNQTCSAGDMFSFYKSYEKAPLDGKKGVTDFGVLSTFAGYDIAVDVPGGLNYDRIIDYHVSKMNGVTPTKTPPVWVFEPGEYPRLLQLND